MSLLHASCVAIDGAGVLIRGASGAGKSDLALRLIDGGAVLVADDYCTLSVEGTTLRATVAAQIAGKLEIRGYGIASLPYQSSCGVSLVIDLAAKETIPRLPDTQTCELLGVQVPWVQINPSAPSAPARVRAIVRDLATHEIAESRSA